MRINPMPSIRLDVRFERRSLRERLLALRGDARRRAPSSVAIEPAERLVELAREHDDRAGERALRRRPRDGEKLADGHGLLVVLRVHAQTDVVVSVVQEDELVGGEVGVGKVARGVV